MRDELKEWYDAADRNTNGSMVYDILKDWKEERAKLMAEINRLKELLSELQQETEADKEHFYDWFVQ